MRRSQSRHLEWSDLLKFTQDNLNDVIRLIAQRRPVSKIDGGNRWLLKRLHRQLQDHSAGFLPTAAPAAIPGRISDARSAAAEGGKAGGQAGSSRGAEPQQEAENDEEEEVEEEALEEEEEPPMANARATTRQAPTRRTRTR